MHSAARSALTTTKILQGAKKIERFLDQKLFESFSNPEGYSEFYPTDHFLKTVFLKTIRERPEARLDDLVVGSEDEVSMTALLLREGAVITVCGQFDLCLSSRVALFVSTLQKLLLIMLFVMTLRKLLLIFHSIVIVLVTSPNFLNLLRSLVFRGS